MFEGVSGFFPDLSTGGEEKPAVSAMAKFHQQAASSYPPLFFSGGITLNIAERQGRRGALETV